MGEQTYNVKFDGGYWREVNKDDIPKKSGVYCVYECKYNEQEGTVSLKKLLYIGESEDVNDRVSNHEKLNEWKKYVGSGNTLCYLFSQVDSPDRERVEAALIYEHKPPVNTEYKDKFPYDTTHITTEGKNALLKESFTVYRKE